MTSVGCLWQKFLGLTDLLTLSLALSLFCLLAANAAETDRTVTWNGYVLDVPANFSDTQKLGMGAVFLNAPAGAPPTDEQAAVTMAAFPAPMVAGMTASGVDLMHYFKTTFLGTAAPAESSVTRTVFGEPHEGQVLTKSIPYASRVEAFLLPMADGGRLGLAIQTRSGMDTARVEAIIDTVTDSLRPAD